MLEPVLDAPFGSSVKAPILHDDLTTDTFVDEESGKTKHNWWKYSKSSKGRKC